MEKYEGWANRPTWCFYLWMSNDRGSYDYCQEIAREQGVKALAEQLQDDMEEGEELLGLKGIYEDLLTWCCHCIDYREVAQAMAEDVKWFDAESFGERCPSNWEAIAGWLNKYTLESGKDPEEVWYAWLAGELEGAPEPEEEKENGPEKETEERPDRMRLLFTRAVNDEIADDEEMAKAVTDALRAFVHGDYGLVCEEDAEANRRDLESKCGHVLGRYGTPHGDIYINRELPGDDVVVMHPEEW